MRIGLIVLLSLGVVAGFGSGFARLAGHRGGCHSGGGERWGYSSYRDGRDGEAFDRNERVAAPVAAPVPQQAPVYIVIPAAPPAAPIIVNGAPAAPAAPANVVVVPAQVLQAAPVAPAAIPQPAPVTK